MIEPFEFEPIRLEAPEPKQDQGSLILRPTGIDNEEFKGLSSFTKKTDVPVLDRQRHRIYQTRFGNPDNVNSHYAHYVPDRLIGMGNMGAGYQAPETLPVENGLSASERLSSYLDQQVQFVPALDKHALPAFKVNTQDAPFLSPGLTSIDARKVSVLWK